MNTRTLQNLIHARAASDGAGVKLRRSLGQHQAARLDPFLMLDEFSSDRPDDYIAGFPAHPHRGFETVTYMLDGHMLHEDHLGNKGHLRSGDVQWMTAGRGIIHSEMPQQEHGLLRGFQLWINLPAHEKLKPAMYRDISSADIPVIEREDGAWIKVIAGSVDGDTQQTVGPIQGLSTDPLYLDIHLPAGARFTHAINTDYNAFVYLYEGSLSIGPAGKSRTLPAHNAGILSSGERIEVTAEANGAHFLLLAGRPLHEPIAQYGPFVMNTQEEVEQAVMDYQKGELTGPLTQKSLSAYMTPSRSRS